MPYVNKPRPYKHEYELQKKRGEHESRMERQRTRREFDKEHGHAARAGKDLEHIKPLSKGGTNSKSNIRVESQHDNRSFHRNSDHSIKKNVPYKKKK